MKKLILSTGNKHKVEEIKDILKSMPIQVVSKNEIGFEEFDVIEDGETLEDNAKKKAVELSKKVEGIVAADDTGLFVDALDGRPGVYSSRYAGEEATYEDNNVKLLSELKDVVDAERTARFRTVIALAKDGKVIKTLEGKCEGMIAHEKSGGAGFGYDPLFVVQGQGKTFAQLGESIKNEISHRANALKKLKQELEVLLED